MQYTADHFNDKKEKARQIFDAQKTIYNPFFKTHVVLNSDGFHHLQFSGRRERNQNEQLLKFRLLPQALEIIKQSGTIQEYRALLTPIGKPSANNGSVPMKNVEYWGMTALVGEHKTNVKAILRRVGDGNITFWSVMPAGKIKNGKQQTFTSGIEDE